MLKKLQPIPLKFLNLLQVVGSQEAPNTTEAALEAPSDPASAEVNRIAYASLSKKDQEAYENVIRAIQERNDLSLLSFLEHVDAILVELSGGENASSEALQREVEQLNELFTFGEGNLDIAIDMRPDSHMSNIEKLLLAILKKRWPTDRTPSTKTEKVFGAAFSRPVRNVLENVLPRNLLKKGAGLGPEQEAAKATIESLLEKVRDARINSRRRFIQGTVAGATGLAMASSGINLLLDDETSEGGNVSLSPEQRILTSFDVQAQNRTVNVTLDIPEQSGYDVNNTLCVYMGAPNTVMQKVDVQSGTTEVPVPDTLVPNGGKLFFSVQLKKDDNTQTLHKDITVEAK